MHKDEFTVVAFLLKSRKAVKLARESIKLKYFTNPALKTFYGAILKSKDVIVTFDVLDKMLRKRAHKTELYEAYSELLKYQNTGADEFMYSKNNMIVAHKKQVMISGVTDLGQHLLGENIDVAEERLKSLLKNVESARTGSDGVTVNLRQDTDTSLSLYAQVEKDLRLGTNESGRTLTGINYIDAITGGGKRGELWVWGAATSEGKTQLSLEIAYRTCTMHKSNVLFVSLEMTVEEMKRLVEARHSHKFLPGGIVTKHIELGTMTAVEKDAYHKSLSDWNSNPNYGQIVLWSPPYGCNVNHIAAKMEQVSCDMDIDLVIVDYAELVSLDRFMEKRLQVTEVMRQMKDVARTFNGNKGVWIFTPHQMSRSGKEKATAKGYYTTSDFAESAGVERTANLCGWNLLTEELKAEGKVRLGICKYRTGRTDTKGTELMADWAHSLLSEIEESSDFETSETA